MQKQKSAINVDKVNHIFYILLLLLYYSIHFILFFLFKVPCKNY